MPRKKFRSFEKAREFARSLKLKSEKEWEQYRRGKLKGYKPIAEDIPKYPRRVYKGQGWQGISDWLGNGKVNGKRNYRPFEEAREFIRSLKLKSQKEWNQYSKGDFKNHKPRPEDIPSSPSTIYKDKGWQGLRDWLGNLS